MGWPSPAWCTRTHPDEGGARPVIGWFSQSLGYGHHHDCGEARCGGAGSSGEAIKSMMRLNAQASQAARASGVRAATDITGFGLIGHASEMTSAGGVRFRIRFDALPWLPAHGSTARSGFRRGAHNNHAFYNRLVTYTRPVTDWQQMLLHDPQTSGACFWPCRTSAKSPTWASAPSTASWPG